MSLKLSLCGGGKDDVAPGRTLKESQKQRRNIFGALPKRRHYDTVSQSAEEVLPEASNSPPPRIIERPVGRSDQERVHQEPILFRTVPARQIEIGRRTFGIETEASDAPQIVS